MAIHPKALEPNTEQHTHACNYARWLLPHNHSGAPTPVNLLCVRLCLAALNAFPHSVPACVQLDHPKSGKFMQHVCVSY